MCKFLQSLCGGRQAAAERRSVKSGIVVTPPMSPEFWTRVLRGQFAWCEGWLLIAILCEIFGAVLELTGFKWPREWSISWLELVIKNATPGIALVLVGIWAAMRARFDVTQEDPSPDDPPPPPPQEDGGCWICRWLRRLFARSRRHGGYITWGRRGIVVPTGSVDKEFWTLAERLQWWISMTGLIGGFLCEVLGVLVVWLSTLSSPQWSASVGGIEIANAPTGAVLFLAGMVLQEITRYVVQSVSASGGQTRDRSQEP